MKTQHTEYGPPEFVRRAVERARHHRHDHQDEAGFGPGARFGQHGFGRHGFGPGMGRDFWRFFGGGPSWGGRRQRGDVRAAILALLKEEPRNGYGIIQEIERRSEGLWKPSAGAVYPALQQLEDEGLIEQIDSGGRREYRLTESGSAYVREHDTELNAPWENAGNGPGEGSIGLLGLVRQVGMAALQVGQAGSPAQIAEARTVLTETRRQLYGILAAEEKEAEPLEV